MHKVYEMTEWQSILSNTKAVDLPKWKTKLDELRMTCEIAEQWGKLKF
jgi:hypothetical protein